MRSLLGVFLLTTSLCSALSNLEQEIVDTMRVVQEQMTETDRQIAIHTTVDTGRPQSQKANAGSQLEQIRGDFLLQLTKELVKKHGFQILPELEKVDIEGLFGSIMEKRRRKRQTTTECKMDKKNCNNAKHYEQRSVTGICNNLDQKEGGAALSPLRRLLGSAKYEDGFNAVRASSVEGGILPSARLISNSLHDEGSAPTDQNTSHFHMQFGQLVSHDIVLFPSAVGPNGETLDCSSCSSPLVTDNCAPIKVPSDDSYFPQNGCIRMTRTINGQKGFGQRQQINQVTHLLDLSVLYGSEECEAAALRTFENGELRSSDNGNRLPQDEEFPSCQSKDPFFCFKAGDERVSVHPALTTIHTVYLKEHNRVAKIIKRARSTWKDEQIYQETRRIVIAEYQHHVYNQYLPHLLGENVMNEFRLKPETSGFFWGYNPSTTGACSSEFAGAAFRFGHSQVGKFQHRKLNNNQTAGQALDLGCNIFYADNLYKDGGTDSLLEGLVQHPAQAVDREISFPMRHQIFETRLQPATGIDLIATNIQRGRDVGVHPYNSYRTLVGLQKATSFDDLVPEMGSSNVEALKKVYKNVNDIDLFPGILMEKPTDGSKLGRTGSYIIAETFSALKTGDRYFYENLVIGTRGLSPDELTSIRQTSLEKVVCDSSAGMEMVNLDIFDFSSPRVRCDSLRSLDIIPFVNGGIGINGFKK